MILGRLAEIYQLPEGEISAQLRPPPAKPDASLLTRSLLDFYAPGRGIYSFQFDGRPRLVPAVCPAESRGLRIPMLAGRERMSQVSVARTERLPELDAAALGRYASYLHFSKARFWDDLVLRLVEWGAHEDHVAAQFAEARFLDYRLTVGLMREEWFDVLAHGGRARLRETFAPDIATLMDFPARIAAGGVNALCAFARPAPFDDFVIPLQVRSASVGEGAGSYGVIPMALHQRAASGTLDPLALSTTALRELYEELFDGPELLTQSAFLEHPAIEWILAHRHEVTFETTSLFVSLIHGNYDCGMLLAVRDTDYWQRFGPLMAAGWESETQLLVSSRDEAAWRQLLTHPGWEAQALGCAVEGLLRLREIDPARVALPTLEAS